MSLISAGFIGLALLVTLIYNFRADWRYREAILFIASWMFIATYVVSFVQIVPLLGFLALGYLAIELVRLHKGGTLFFVCISAILVSYVVLKRYSFFQGYLALSFPYLIVGLSYILFRILHIVIDMREGAFNQRIPVLRYLNYTTNFLCFISGPIQQYPQYEADLERAPRAPNAEQVFAAFRRVVLGYFKICVLSGIANYIFSKESGLILSPISHLGHVSFTLHYYASALCYTYYLYMNFSGYMDVVIGLGSLLDRELPENFNRPFLATGFLEFWGRWHMTLSNWFKIYLFNPLLKFCVERISAASIMPWLGVLIFFVTFLVMGLWHGTTLVFLIYGLLMGLGASMNKLWQVGMVAWAGKKKYKKFCELPLYHYFCRGITLAYFSLGITCLWVNMPQLLLVLQKQGVVAGVGGLFFLAAACGMLMFVIDKAYGAAIKLRQRFAFQPGLVASNLSLAFAILAIFFITSFFHKAPEFIYKAF